MNQMAYDQVAPDVLRARNDALKDYSRSLASTGGYRFGTAKTGAEDLRNKYQRQLSEQQSQFSGQTKDWLTDWYNRQAQDYYKTPSRWKSPALPTWDTYMQDAGISPSQSSSELQGLEAGGWNPTGGFQSAELGNTVSGPQNALSPAYDLQKQNRVKPLMGVTNPNFANAQPLKKNNYLSNQY